VRSSPTARWHHALHQGGLHQPLLRRDEPHAADLVKEIHLEYVQAGAEIIETNTFGANRVKLAASAWRRSSGPSTRPACGSRAGGGANAFVAGAIGPLGVKIEPLGPTSFAETREFYESRRPRWSRRRRPGDPRDLPRPQRDSRGALAVRDVAGHEMVWSRRSPSMTKATCPRAAMPRPSRRGSTSCRSTSSA